jgi:acetoin utilization protein AcuB
MKVRNLMSAPAAAVAPSDSLYVADGIMSMGGVRHLPVVGDGELLGVVSQRDILRAPGLLSPLLSSTKTVLKALRVADVMSRDVVTIAADTSVEEAARTLLEHRVGCLPVLESGGLVGIVTTSDLLRAIAGPLDTDAAATEAERRPSAARGLVPLGA